MDCCNTEEQELYPEEFKVLLIGNPNVGKSVVFSKLTGMDVLSANYAGTTISFTKGNINFQRKKGVLIDAPGTYSLEASCPAEEVVIEMLKEEKIDRVICVLDATNLERNLNLALQVKQFNIPTVFALNLIDVAERQGISIDVEELEKELGAPVVPTVAIRNIGLRDVLNKVWSLDENDSKDQDFSSDECWQEVGRIVKKVQRVEHRHPTFLEKLGDAMIQPFPGIPIALLVLALALAVVVGGGKGIRAVLLLPLVTDIYAPFMTNLVSGFVSPGVLLNVLVGEYGFLIKAIEWPFALVLPYVFLFYIVLSFLEDSGYMPRLAVLVDGILRRIGIQGGSIVPFMMGYGCAVPAILGTRAATTHKERVIIAGLVSFAVPCTAQTAALIVLLGDHSVLLLLSVFMVSLLALLMAGVVLNRIIPGKIDPMLLEVPNLLKPNGGSLGKKIWMRTKHYVFEAAVPMFIAISFAALIAETGVLAALSNVMAPLTEVWLGLPKEASLALLLGIVRRELAVLPLLELQLSGFQLLVGSLVALFYIPCLSVLGVLIKEFKAKIATTIFVVTIAAALLIAGIVNQVGTLFGF